MTTTVTKDDLALNALNLTFLDISKNIDKFLEIVSKKYGIDKKELSSQFNNCISHNTQKGGIESNSDRSYSTTPTTVQQYGSYTKPDLIKLCKEKGIEKGLTGKSKQQLLELLGRRTEVDVPQNKVAIRKNKYGNYEHPTLKFVFTSKGVVYGKQEDDKIIDLTKEDIIKCKEEKFKFEMPILFNDSINIDEKTDETIIKEIQNKIDDVEKDKDTLNEIDEDDEDDTHEYDD